MPIAIIAIIIIALLGAGFYSFSGGTKPEIGNTPEEVIENELPTGNDPAAGTLPAPAGDPAQSDDPAVSGLAPESEVPVAPVVGIADGSYTASASYFTPARQEHDLSVSVTVAGGVITAADVLYDGGEAETPSHRKFEGAYEAAVVGQSIENLSLSRTGGASLTAEAFNEALDTIKQEAAL